MGHLPALAAAYPAYCWIWVTNMTPATGKYEPGWFHVGVTKPDDGDSIFVGREGPVGWRPGSPDPRDFAPGS